VPELQSESEMKYSSCLILTLISNFSAFGSKLVPNIITDSEIEEASTISRIASEIIDVYFVNRGIEFDIFIWQDSLSKKTETIINEVISNSNGRFKYQIYSYDECTFQPISRQIIIFIDTLLSFFCFKDQFKIIKQQSQFNNLAFIDESLIPRLKDFQSINNRLHFFSSSIFQYTNFIASFSDTIQLCTFDWFTTVFCNNPTLVTLNSYEKILQKWIKPLKFSKKFLNFQGCELVLMVPVLRCLMDSNIWGYSVVIHGSSTYEVYGIIPKIFEIASEKYNFKDEYQPVYPHYQTSFIRDPTVDSYDIIYINRTYREPNVCIEFLNIRFLSDFVLIRHTIPFIDISRILLVTPDERYTSYEKLFLPFDKNIWIFLFGTVFTVLSISFVTDNLLRTTENFIFGATTLKILRIFFGLPQTHMPVRNFSRQIVILFIFFCLIIRSCFQSKVFQIMTSDQRHPPPMTISDLIDRQYTIYTPVLNEDFEFLEAEHNIR